MQKINVGVVGACGKMGREVVRAVCGESDLVLTAAVDTALTGEDIGSIVGIGPTGVLVTDDLQEAIKSGNTQVIVDFTTPDNVRSNIDRASLLGVNCVVGTTGISIEDIEKLDLQARSRGVGMIIAPNFAIGAILMMKFSELAARYFGSVEIIELHHDQKLDAPSGTSVKTAEMIASSRSEFGGIASSQLESLPGARGAEVGGIRVHSVRLPGYIAHQEVIFGGPGQILTIRHDSMSRESFMPGVLMAVRNVVNVKGVVYGLDKLMDL